MCGILQTNMEHQVQKNVATNHLGMLGLALGGDRYMMVCLCPFKVLTFGGGISL